MKAFARINRLERLLRKPVRGIRYTMPDSTLRILPVDHSGFTDAVQGVNTPPARIVLAAVTDSRNNGGAMLKLLFACLHPIDTEPVEEPIQDAVEV